MRVDKRLLVWLSVFVLMIIVYGCKEKLPSSEDGMKAYLKAWSKGEYEDMYEQLSGEAKAAVSKDVFVTRHSSIYEGISASELDIQLVFSSHDENGDKARDTFGIHVKMTTLAGEVEFDQTVTMVLENKAWRVEWTPGFIFPQLQESDKVRVQSLKAERGAIVDRSGQSLAFNEEQLEIGIVPKDLPEPAGDTLKRLAGILQSSEEEIEQKKNRVLGKAGLFRSDRRIVQRRSEGESRTSFKGHSDTKQKSALVSFEGGCRASCRLYRQAERGRVGKAQG